MKFPALCTVVGPVGVATNVEVVVGSAEDNNDDERDDCGDDWTADENDEKDDDDRDEEDNDACPATMYKFNRFPFPHSSVVFPAQVIEQSFSAVFTLPAPSVFPQ